MFQSLNVIIRYEHITRNFINLINPDVIFLIYIIRSNKMQQYAGIYLLQNLLYMFRASIAPIIRST